MKALEPKMFQAKQQYDNLVSQYAELRDQRYPERREENVKNALYEAFQKSDRTLDENLALHRRRRRRRLIKQNMNLASNTNGTKKQRSGPQPARISRDLFLKQRLLAT